MSASDRLGEVRRLNTMAYPSVATGNFGGGPRLTDLGHRSYSSPLGLTRTCTLSGTHTAWFESHAPLCETCLGVQPFCLFSFGLLLSSLLFLSISPPRAFNAPFFPLNKMLSQIRRIIISVKTSAISLYLNECEIYVYGL